MDANQTRVQALREAWEYAIGKDRPKDALAALEGLELLDPEEARWAHRKGEVLRRLGKPKEAEAAFVRAVQRYVAQGFLTRAAALAKVIVELNPARTDVLAELNQAPARQLRDDNRIATTSALNPKMPPPPRLPSGTMQAVRPAIAMAPNRVQPIPRDEPSAELPTKPGVRSAMTQQRNVALPPPGDGTGVESPFLPGSHSSSMEPPEDWDEDPDSEEARSTLVAGVRAERLSVVAAAMGLESATDAASDEVRFQDVPDVFAIEVDVSELEEDAPPTRPREPSAPEIEVGGFDDEEAPTAVRLTLMSAATLFVDVPKEAMAELVAAAQLIELVQGTYVYRSGEPADGLYVVVEGKVNLVPAGANKKLVVSEGSVFGEDSLLQGALRNADTRVNGRLLALRIPKDALDGIVKRHAALGDVLFSVLIRRLVTMALQSSPLFSAFDIPTRKELARLFEVRRAAAGIIIKQRGKRSDGLYLPLAGEFEADDGSTKTMLPLGTMFGHTSLISDAPEQRTVRVRRESVVLRLAASRFVSFAARFPAALSHLTELAKSPQAF